MKLTIPFHYQFWYVPVRCQNDREAFAKTAIDVEIPEVSDEDAPVVMTVANKKVDQSISRGYSRFLPKPDGSPRRVRMRDGYFYVEGFGAEEFVERASNIATLNSTFLSWIGKYDKRPGSDKGVTRTITSVSELRWSRSVGGLREDKTRDDGGAKTGAKIAAQAAKMLVIDGVTYERCREPVLTLVMDDDRVTAYGIVEADQSLVARLAAGLYGNSAACTSSLVHAGHVMERAGVDPSILEYTVIDPAASSYDGVSADIVYALFRAKDKLKEIVKASPAGALQAFYRVREALEHVDLGSPSVSAELVAAAQSIIDIVADPDIGEPMSELANARYMTDRSGRALPGGNPNEGGPFILGLAHVSDYQDVIGYGKRARQFAEIALDRWEGRHPQSTFDNGQTQRMTSRGGDGLTVAEIGSDAQARLAAREIGVDYAVVDGAVGAGSRVFRVSEDVKVATSLSNLSRSVAVGLVIGPSAGVADGSWTVFAGKHPKADIALQAVGEHVEAMDERDMELSQDQQLISIF